MSEKEWHPCETDRDNLLLRPERVTDDMIDRALKAWFASPPSETDQGLERSMRAALKAALNTVLQGPETTICNYPKCDGGPNTGYCHIECRHILEENCERAIKRRDEAETEIAQMMDGLVFWRERAEKAEVEIERLTADLQTCRDAEVKRLIAERNELQHELNDALLGPTMVQNQHAEIECWYRAAKLYLTKGSTSELHRLVVKYERSKNVT